MAKKSKIYFTQVVAIATGDAFLAGHVQEQGSEPTFTRFAKAGDAGWAHLGDLGTVVYATVAIPVAGAPRPWVAALGREGLLRIYKPGQQPVDRDVPLSDKSSYLEGICVASDGIYVCGGQKQVSRLANDQWSSVDQGLFEKYNRKNGSSLYSIAEVSAGVLVAVGTQGLVACRVNDGAWQVLDPGTNVDLHCVIPSDDGGAWIAGDGGTLLKLSADRATWTDHADHGVSTQSFDDLSEHHGTLYITGFDQVLSLAPGATLQVEPVPFSKTIEFHNLSAAGDYLWVTGDEHVHRLGPEGWKYFLCPDNA
jgi:hypothetical protein